MRTIGATAVINAPLPAVWRVLGDGQQYAERNPVITVVSGDLTPGRDRRCGSSHPASAPRPSVRESSTRPLRRVWVGSVG
jgi:hypothetical protein